MEKDPAGALIVGALALAAVAGQALAQGGPGDGEQPPPRQEECLSRLADELRSSAERLAQPAEGSRDLMISLKAGLRVMKCA